jgi:hypothetical protein
MAARMHDINCASARHLEAFADIPQELADKIVSYRKYRKRIFHIDELYRIGGISRKYFRRLVSVFYVPNQVVPGIGAHPPYSNALSTVSVQQKHQNTNANLKKRKMKIKKHEKIQRQIYNRDRKRELQEEGNSTQYKPLDTKCYLNSTNLKRLSTVTYNKLPENLEKKIQNIETADTEQKCESSESAAPSTRRPNINERVASLLAAMQKSECDTIDMEEDKRDVEEDNIDTEEDNILTYRKRPYRCVKKPETTDTENSSDSSESTPPAVVQGGSINERVARLLANVPKLEYDTIYTEGDKIDMEVDNSITYRKRPYRCVIKPETADTENSSDSSESTPPAVVQGGNIIERVARLLANVPKLEYDTIYMEEDNIITYRKRPYRCIKLPETTDTENSSDSSESTPSLVVQGGNINQKVARLLANVPKLEYDNINMEEIKIDMEEIKIEMEEDKIDMEEDKIDMEEEKRDLEEDKRDMEEDNIITYRKRPYRCVKRPETADTENSSDSSESTPPAVVQGENINQKVARLLANVPKLEYDNINMEEVKINREEDKRDMEEDKRDMEEDKIDTEEDKRDMEEDKRDMEEDKIDTEEDKRDMEEDKIDMEEDKRDMEENKIDTEEEKRDMEEDKRDMEEDKIDMEEDNIITYRKRPYRCVKRPETADTENSNDSSESTPSAVVQRGNINERAARFMEAMAILEGDNIDMEDDKLPRDIETEEDNIPGDEDLCTNWYTHIRR